MSENQRPSAVTLLALIILGFALWNGIRLVQAIVFWSILIEYISVPGPLYIAISGGIWLGIGLIIVLGIRQGKGWAWIAALCSVVCYGAWYWIDKLVLQESRANWQFALASTGFFILLLGILFLRGTTHFFYNNSRNKIHISQTKKSNTEIPQNK